MKYVPFICAVVLVCAWALATTAVTTVTQGAALRVALIQAAGG